MRAVGDHGLRAQGEGWLLTVALIEGVSLPKADVTGFSDPYVVFTCNGMSRTSSVKLQTLNPEWNGASAFALVLYFSGIFGAGCSCQ